MENYLANANSPIMWAACSVMVIVALLQAAWFMRKSYHSALESGISKNTINHSIRAAAITAVGPSAANAVAMIALVGALGAPLAWHRLTVIGNITYELSAANVAAMSLGATLGGEGFTGTTLALAAWLCATGSAGYLLIVTILCPSFGKMRTKLTKVGGAGAIALLSGSSMVGLFANFTGPNLLSGQAPTLAAVLGGGIFMAGLTVLANQKRFQWLKEWILGIAMIAGMLCSLLFI